MKIKRILAKSISYGGTRRLSDIFYIVIHYTSNKGDTAENNGLYFKNVNKIKAGAHFFIDQKGNVVQSINLNRIAWAVGGSRYSDWKKTGGGNFYGLCTNANSVSIELCDNATKDPSNAQIEATKDTIAYIQSKCKNAKLIIRHFDVTGKCCPKRMTNINVWNRFKKRIKP